MLEVLRRALRGVVFVASTLAAAEVGAVDVTVSAAASLRDAFTEIAREFEKDNSADKVLLNFAASGQLLQQITRGAPVDVFASADQDTMDRAAAQNVIDRSSRVDFARNRLVLVTALDATAAPKSLADLTGPAVKRIAIGTPESVPAGRYAKGALDAAGLWSAVQPKLINTQNVRQALDYVARGETDAGFVYHTDAMLVADRVRIGFEVATKEPVVYPVAVVKGGGAEAVGRRFVKFLTSEKAQRVLAKFGFGRP
ncbi:MAG: molybdate ABC transporter substrate-binding protein [Burkholderiales bacterium]|nr:molybdate ABC transporter substrate-binding protein [Burkholderiales bacterium]